MSKEQTMSNVIEYRSKPVKISAIQILWSNWSEICDFGNVPTNMEGCYLDQDGNETEECTNVLGVKIKTLEGTMLGKEGDYLIKGTQGEFYPCKKDIFEAKYIKVEEKEGLYQKYYVERLDGKRITDNIVLEVKDKNARNAMLYYSTLLRPEFPELAKDIVNLVENYEKRLK